MITLKESGRLYWPPLMILSLGILSIVIIVSLNYLRQKQSRNYYIEHVLMSLQIDISDSHLWIEEYLTGDTTISSEKCLAGINQSVELAEAMLSGGKTWYGWNIPALDDPELTRRMESVLSRLREFKAITLERFDKPEISGIGSAIDQRFDALFNEIIGEVHILEGEAHNENFRLQTQSGRLSLGILLIWVVLISLAVVGFWVRDSLLKRTKEELNEARKYAESIVKTVREPLVILDADLRVLSVNQSFCMNFEVTPEETEGQLIYEIGNRQWDIPELQELLEKILPDNTAFDDFKVEHKFPAIGRRIMLLNARRIYREADKTQMILLAIEDITERVRLQSKVSEQMKVEKAISRVLHEGLRSTDLTDAGQACLNVALEITSSAFGFVGEVNERGTFDTTFQADPGWEACRIPRDQAVVLINDMEIRGLWGEVIKQNKTLMTNDPSSHPASVGTPKGHPPIRCFLGVPLLRGERAFGVIGVANKPSGYTEEDCEFLERLSVAFVMAMDRSRAEEALRDREEFFSDTLNDMLTFVGVLGPDGKILFVNNTPLILAGIEEEDVIGKMFYDTYWWQHSEEARETIKSDIDRCASGEILVREIQARFEGGQLKWVDFSMHPIYDEDGSVKYLIPEGRDITERKRAERKLDASNRALKTLSTCNQAVIHATEESELLHEICRVIVEEGGYRLVWVGYAEHDEQKSVRPVAQSGYEEGYLDTVNITWADTERGRGPTGTAIRTGKPSICNNMMTDPRYEPWRAEASKRGYASSIAVPLIANGQAFGAINIYAVEPDAFNVDEVELLKELADDLAHGITALRVREERKEAGEELRNSRDMLRNLSIHLQSVREEERTRIAREIHDELGQVLTALKMDVSWLDKRLPEDKKHFFEKTKSMSKVIDMAIRTIQRVSAELRPGLLDDIGLTAAIEWQAAEFQNRTGIKCKITFDPKEIVLDRDRSTAVFRIFQETLTNVARHANASNVKVSLKEETDELILEVIDNGKGITEEQISSGRSFGLIGMQERVYPFGGEVKVEGIKGKGTTVRVSLPPSNQEMHNDKSSYR